MQTIPITHKKVHVYIATKQARFVQISRNSRVQSDFWKKKVEVNLLFLYQLNGYMNTSGAVERPLRGF